MGDFTLQTTAVAVLPSQANRQVTFTFHVDSIAQELDETVRLRLSVSQSVLNRFAGQFDISVFFLDTTDLVIVDSDSKYMSCSHHYAQCLSLLACRSGNSVH